MKIATWLVRLRTAWACLAALGVGGVLMAAGGGSPVDGYRALFTTAFFDYWGFATTLVKTCPILLAALAVALPLRAGLFNIGAEGQIYIGALGGTVVALALPPLPAGVGMSLVMMVAALSGGAWAAVPGYLKAYRGVNEVIVTLLLNFVAIQVVSWAVSGPLLAPSAPYPYSDEIAEPLRLPIVLPQTDAHAGIVVGVVAALLLHVFMRFTAAGHAIDLIGRNPHAAAYAGVAVRRQTMLVMAGGGALAGLAGGLEVLGLKYRLFHLFSPGYGFDGIVVAFMAGANMAWVPVAALLLGGLKAAAGGMQRAAGVPGTVVEAIQGLVVIFVAASPGISWRRLRMRLFESRRAAGMGAPVRTKETA